LCMTFGGSGPSCLIPAAAFHVRTRFISPPSWPARRRQCRAATAAAYGLRHGISAGSRHATDVYAFGTTHHVATHMESIVLPASVASICRHPHDGITCAAVCFLGALPKQHCGGCLHRWAVCLPSCWNSPCPPDPGWFTSTTRRYLGKQRRDPGKGGTDEGCGSARGGEYDRRETDPGGTPGQQHQGQQPERRQAQEETVRAA